MWRLKPPHKVKIKVKSKVKAKVNVNVNINSRIPALSCIRRHCVGSRFVLVVCIGSSVRGCASGSGDGRGAA
ncbi:MAG: hypothetical protein LBH93_01830 [Chitinispirillales bacterium]|nr:hypothetical protein [Chitinispirillales bacterium]